TSTERAGRSRGRRGDRESRARGGASRRAESAREKDHERFLDHLLRNEGAARETRRGRFVSGASCGGSAPRSQAAIRQDGDRALREESLPENVPESRYRSV